MALDGSRPENHTQHPTKNTRAQQRMFTKIKLKSMSTVGGALEQNVWEGAVASFRATYQMTKKTKTKSCPGLSRLQMDN